MTSSRMQTLQRRGPPFRTTSDAAASQFVLMGHDPVA